MITSVTHQYDGAIQQVIDNKTKPMGALGMLESLARQLASIQSHRLAQLCTKISLSKPTMLVFAGDHGIAQHGVSIAPSDVTHQMVHNFLAGGAAINCFCRTNHIDFYVVDAGIQTEIDEVTVAAHPELIIQRLGAGTADFSSQPAMTPEQVRQGLNFGKQAAQRILDQGCELLMFGEMGIANTSAASALFAALSDVPVVATVGRGTGISIEQLNQKQQLIQQALMRFSGRAPLDVLAEVGGFEIVQMIGAMQACAERKIPMLIDGFIVSVAAFVATQLDANIRDYLIFAHCSDESAHRILLGKLVAKPILDLSLRLGEGTGAALAFPILASAASFYNDMASFESAGVTV
ncbi:nicotinate-nucleotide--dimethylbenzimidazole phosphoribosyltransferase [Thalassotalea fusca]